MIYKSDQYTLELFKKVVLHAFFPSVSSKIKHGKQHYT